MNLSWLTSNFSKEKNKKTTVLKHQVLGTLLNAPLGDCEEEILFGCGCFWGAEKGFWKLPGVITTAVGYAGGQTVNPQYKEVCTGNSGHSEVVRVVWNNSIIDLSDLLKLFWECHDPTQGNRQGNDFGSQYRSAVFTSNPKQTELAIASKISYEKKLINKGYDPISTEIKEGVVFYFAENYHQQYLAKPGSRPYCSAMPTNISLEEFPNANFKLPKNIWSNFDWSTKHCVLRSNNNPIEISLNGEDK
tara:strand:- start:384 stop:1124 length:741 start_codon:yes stop_codon:yes gene_type:complete